jgi:glycosyltransferase involved in cell wall biosynthesis
MKLAHPARATGATRGPSEPFRLPTGRNETMPTKSTAPCLPFARGVAGGTVTVEVVVPVHNEERALRQSIERLHRFLRASFPFTTTITIADNASNDGTWAIANELVRTIPGVTAIRLEDKGRGRALRAAWTASAADVVAYMDVDLSTGLDALLPLVAPLLSGHSDVAIGTRLSGSAYVVRGVKREVLSRTYNALVHLVLHGRFSDAQCGFKALRRDVATALLPLVEDESWFFDTELLVIAQRASLRIHEVPVDWVDDHDSRVQILRTVRDDLVGMARLAWGRGRRAGRTMLTIPGPARSVAR